MDHLGRTLLLGLLLAVLAGAGCAEPNGGQTGTDPGGGDPADTDCVGADCTVECSADSDGDGQNDCDDPCPADNPDDSDGDGVCEGVDQCLGDDATGDYNANGVCDDRDWPSPTDCVGDGVYDHVETGLCWQNPDYNLPYARSWSYTQATAYCADLELDGYTDWRLPTLSELRTIIEGCPSQVAGGACGLTDSCLEAASCDGGSCGYCNIGPGYLVPFLTAESDSSRLFSSSRDPSTGDYYLVEFGTGYFRAVDILERTSELRCVRIPGDVCTDEDGDGVCDAVDLCPGEDDRINGDGDALPECLDECNLDPMKVVEGECGCGEVDQDQDEDDVYSCDDACDNDPDKTEPGPCGCGQVDVLDDGDGDGVYDCVDPCPVHNPDDPDGDGLCGVAVDYCAGIGDADGDHVCDPDDSCTGDDKYGDRDGDGICDHLDLCDGDDATGDADGDYICDDQDVCDGLDAYGDWDADGLCNNLDPDCEHDPEHDLDGDGICASNDLCSEPAHGEDDDFDGYCMHNDECVGDYFDDQDRDGICTSVDPCPLDYHNDADYDGLCANLDPCLGDNRTGDSDQDGYCDDIDACTGFDPLGDADGDGLCDSHVCLSIPPFYDQNSSDVARAAGGACIELHHSPSVIACTEAQHAKYQQDIEKIMADYPFTDVVFYGHNSGPQSYLKDPYILKCTFEKLQVADQAMFDDINSCYHGRTAWNFNYSGNRIEFDWAVNVWDLVDIYHERAVMFGGFCELDGAVGGVAGFHATADDFDWTTWTVKAKSYCDYDGCRCDATFDGMLGPDSTQIFGDYTSNSSCYNAGTCNPQQFPDWATHYCENPEFYF